MDYRHPRIHYPLVAYGQVSPEVWSALRLEISLQTSNFFPNLRQLWWSWRLDSDSHLEEEGSGPLQFLVALG